MPRVKKPSSEFGALGDLNRKVLLRCRMLLLRDMDVPDILEYMSSDEGFKTDIREQILNFPTREQRVGCFLDRLHSRSDKTFLLFMEALKEHYKHLHYWMEETVKTVHENEVHENQHREKVALSGEAVRKLLRNNLHKADSDLVNGESIDGSLDVEILVEEKEEDDYINCYAIPMRGRLQQESWVKHTDYVSREDEIDAQRTSDSYMAALVRNILFKKIEPCDIPEQVKKPSKYCTVYVVDPNPQENEEKKRENKSPGVHRQLSIKETVEHFVFESPEDDDDIPSTTPPPPVPPKPDNLPPLSSMPNSRSSVSEEEAPPPPPPQSAPPAETPPTEKKIAPVVPPKPKIDKEIKIENDINADEENNNTPHSPEDSNDHNNTSHNAEDSKDNLEAKSDQEGSVDDTVDATLIEEESKEPEKQDGEGKADSGDSVTVEPKPVDKVDDIYYSSTCSSISTNTLTADNNLEVKKDLLDIEEEQYEPITPTLDTTEEEEEEQPVYGDQPPVPHRNTSPLRNADGDSNPSLGLPDESSKASGDSLDSTRASGSLRSNTDSGVEFSLAIPPRRTSRASANRLPLLPPLLPGTLSDVHIAPNNVSSDSDDSYYEDIDLFDRQSPSMLSSTSYLDPRSYVKSSDKSGKFDKFKDGKFNFTPADLDIPKRILLKKDDHLVAENSEVFTPTEDVCRESPLHQFLSVSLAFDKSGSAFYIPTNLLKRYGDPEGESWFYPIPLSSRQATLFLEAEKQEGCFVVYRAMNSNVAYNLSVCRKNGDVVHYHIVENNHGDVMIRGHDHSFMNIQNLVKFFQGNKSQLATRLRRPLKEARLPIIPGYHYDARYELNRSSLNLTGKIIGKGHFGVVCSAVYRSSTVAVKVLQRSDLTTTDEDDFIEEARVMMGLKHDHVVRLIGVSCTAKPFFIVTEFISRGSLRDCLRQHNLPAESIDIFFDLCIQVTAAMYYLESQKYLLHRDVAARNFLLTEDMCVKLSDFGRACFVNDDNYQAAKSEKISIKWAAPEVLLNSTYSTKSDVWSIGVVYWEIFSAGARPYTEMSSEQATMYVIEGGRLDKPVGCSPDLYSIMKQCWRELPEERPSFTALYDKLKSKSSIYYVRTVRAEKTASLPLTTSMKVSSPNKPKLMTPKSQTLKPTKSRKLTIGVDDAYGDDQLDYGRKVSTLGSNQHHSSSSEVSLASQNQMDTSKDDIDRGGLIRKSLRKIGVMRRPKKKNSKIDLRMDDADRRSAGAFYSPN